jgi:hypothetical protein
MKKEHLATAKKLQVVALRIALVVVGIPLRLASHCTWQLETWRSRLQTAIHTLENQDEN